jgi:hypothetical protein
VIGRSTEETIQHDIDNSGRRLISVQWDIGVTDYVFPAEIEIREPKLSVHYNRRTVKYFSNAAL